MTANQASTPHFHALIAAAGSGTRAGLGGAKQFHVINGKTILERSIDIFANHPKCASIHVIIDPKDAKKVHDLNISDKIDSIINGSTSRKKSIYNGLKALSYLNDKDIILTHDAARAFTHLDDLNALLDAMHTSKAATLAKPVTDTLRKNDNGRIDRSDLFALQTPQAFHYGLIKQAHEQLKDDNSHTDETSLVTATGETVTFVTAQHMNEKITYPKDIMIASALLTAETETRIGQGYDVHAFEAEKTARKLVLCGVEIPHDFALSGHSDADVGFHAITDALLGAIAQGDIGRHFPPSDDAFKDMDSAIFLKKARDLINQANGTIINIDLTLICETPKITPHAQKMIEQTAKILKITPSQISIKATTSEGLGFTGRREGIAATAIATVKAPA